MHMLTYHIAWCVLKQPARVCYSLVRSFGHSIRMEVQYMYMYMYMYMYVKVIIKVYGHLSVNRLDNMDQTVANLPPPLYLPLSIAISLPPSLYLPLPLYLSLSLSLSLCVSTGGSHRSV